MLHHLKTLPEYFQAVIDGRKPFEVRKDDRGFKPGDKVILEEYAGFIDIPACPDEYLCRKGWHRPPDGHDYWEQPEECLNKNCSAYRKDIYIGRRCLIKIKEIFKLDGAGLTGYVAFTFDILNIVDKRGD